ncbi:hypothetical protein KCM76_24645 [Zooshikella marina]|uniref:hypothetical protein n=1 Tax=Zooshikella ganghwensis TaxID=202772 RepID=UPI001BB00EBE|nr:hypothetical protein [Zooshikella ganghwensis]MBU2709207.1 hypothetical protein [Zooshikella ganghwensis]
MSCVETTIFDLKEKLKFTIEYYQPAWMFADEVIVELSKYSVSDYDLATIFTKAEIDNYILDPCKKYLIAYEVGGDVESFIKLNSTPTKMTNSSSLIPICVKIFKLWQERGWIKITKTYNPNLDLSIESLIGYS